ncbi:response regulator [Desulfolutivibrio sulfoxidireducens]|uniref:response regulator n=1 Tax=Desulfolutivibrio sulfoxidireducens TaxID=2773299 RepID=UPI00159D5FAE|nr:response regulator [Desulfolutivibrio sulfoxidireducens]QLA16914.1 response regulator [Desulfolutivibrio sulfoxidireducens]QLA20480.1 response regulator [Desulfolutivibrio sulfoxidireducens]
MKQHILIVDGDPLALTYHEHILSQHFSVETATSAEDALARLRQNGPFAVVVSDLFLPTRGGKSFLAKVQRLCPDIVNIVLAANPTPETIMGAINENHVFGFFCKTAPPAELIRKIRAALEHHRHQSGLRLPYGKNVLTSEERDYLHDLTSSWPC